MVFPEMVSTDKGSTAHKMDFNFILVPDGFQGYGSYCFSCGALDL